MILSLFRPAASPVPALLYNSTIAASRREAFYRDMQVPDTVQGRFEMAVIHAWLLLRQARRHPALQELAQDFIDILFTELDSALRELGIGDMAVPRRMKKLAGAVYGRFQAYDEALASGEAAMRAALSRNIAMADGEAGATSLATYALAADGWLERHFDAVRALAGDVAFPPIEAA